MADPLTALVAGVALAAIAFVLLRPDRGLLHRWRRTRRMDERAHGEHALKYLYESELEGTAPSLQSVAGAIGLSMEATPALLQGLQDRGFISMGREGIRLTAAGRELGIHILRAHRLWESYLADRTGFPEVEWHGRAHDLEHGLSTAEVDALSARLQHPTHDPHGDPIPTATGELSGQQGVALTAAPLDRPLRVLHMEDEPAAVYAQLVAVGLQPGMLVRILEVSPQRVRLLVGGAAQVLAPLVAASVSVAPLEPAAAEAEPAGEPLDALRPGEEGRVLAISRRCRGSERRRLLDLGVLPGTVIRAELRSPNGDPTAYRIRDAIIALRADQAQFIKIERVTGQVAAAA
jgi:DtxR family Mn-dependent transcriptional regulator